MKYRKDEETVEDIEIFEKMSFEKINEFVYVMYERQCNSKRKSNADREFISTLERFSNGEKETCCYVKRVYTEITKKPILVCSKTGKELSLKEYYDSNIRSLIRSCYDCQDAEYGNGSLLMDKNGSARRLCDNNKRFIGKLEEQLYQNDTNKKKTEESKKKKKPIAATVKRLVWNTYIGEEIGKAKCLCCKSTDITQMSFNCGHIISEANGGDAIVSNLKPICQNCNSSMGTQNMDEFMSTLK